MKKLWILYSAFVSFSAQSQKADEAIKKGNDHYKEKLFVKAAEEYNKALRIEPGNQTAKYNLANAFYKQDNKVDAAQLFNGIINSAKEKASLNDAVGQGLLAKVYYNKGVILSQQKNLEASIEAYKSALRNDPNDIEARENLQKALLELKKKSPPPPKKKEQEKKKQPQQQKQPQSKLNQKEAEQRLKLLEQKEKQTQQKMQSERSKSAASSSKDW